jgi:hypothetical protein
MIQVGDLTILGVGSVEKRVFPEIVELQNSTDKSAFKRYPRELRLRKPITPRTVSVFVSAKSGQTVLIENVNLCSLKQAGAPAPRSLKKSGVRR